MAASDDTDTLNLALRASGLEQVAVVRRPRLLSEMGPCYESGELAQGLERDRMRRTRGATFHPMTQGGATQGPHPAKLGGVGCGGKIERWHRTRKNRILLENRSLPGGPEAGIATFVDHYDTRRSHESLDNLTPVNTGRRDAIHIDRRLQHIQHAA